MFTFYHSFCEVRSASQRFIRELIHPRAVESFACQFTWGGIVHSSPFLPPPNGVPFWRGSPGGLDELGEALGILHPITCFAAKQLLSLQTEDGGFAATQGTASSPAATGMAISILANYLDTESQPLQRAVDYLLDRQDRHGLWGGATAMYGPRPFEIDYNYQSHALAAIGMLAVNAAQMPSTNARSLWANTSVSTDLSSLQVSL